MHGIHLAGAGLLEIAWVLAMKKSEGFTRPMESAITVVAMIGSFWLLSLAMRVLPLGTAYTVWTGIGAVGAFLLGILLLGETANLPRFAGAVMILAGLITIKVASPT